MNPTAPRILDFLRNHRDAAADAALAAALPHIDGPMQIDLVGLILERNQPDGLTVLPELFDRLSPAAQARIVSNSAKLFAALRLAVRSPESQARQNVLQIVARSENPRLAYLAALAIHDGASKIRADAGRTLLDLARHHLRTRQQTTDLLREVAEHDRALASAAVMAVQMAAEERRFLLDAIRDALGSFESHHRPEVLEAAMLFADEMEDMLFGGGSYQRGKLTRALLEILGDRLRPVFAPLVYVSLPHADLRRRVVSLLAACRDTEFFSEFIRLRWLSSDPRISRHLLHVRSLEWLRDGFEPAFALAPDVAALAPDWLMRLGIPPDQKISVLSHFLVIDNVCANRAAAWALARVDTPTSTLLLHDAMEHDDACVRSVARAELDRRRRKSPATLRPTRQDRPSEWARLIESSQLSEDFEDFWQNFERISPLLARQAGRKALQFVPGLETALRTKFADRNPADRIRALRLAMALNLAGSFKGELHKLCNDSVTDVRATAVRSLGFIPDATSHRIIDRALRAEDPAVQVQAIESVEQIGAARHVAGLSPLLDSEHADVRAAAVRVLLRLQAPRAAQTLLEMLQDDRLEHRCSALWVIDRLNLTAAVPRLTELAEKDPDPRVARTATQLLRKFGRTSPGPSAVDGPLEVDPRDRGETPPVAAPVPAEGPAS